VLLGWPWWKGCVRGERGEVADMGARRCVGGLAEEDGDDGKGTVTAQVTTVGRHGAYGLRWRCCAAVDGREKRS